MTDRDRLIELLQNTNNYCFDRICSNCEYDKKGNACKSNMIAEYLLANGVIVPPCKVGDTVYYFSHRPFNLSLLPNTIYEADVVRIVTTKLGTSVVIQIHNDYGCTEVPQISDFGKTVFLTKEEAEAELEKRCNNG